jgi:hypothetical protein
MPFKSPKTKAWFDARQKKQNPMGASVMRNFHGVAGSSLKPHSFATPPINPAQPSSNSGIGEVVVKPFTKLRKVLDGLV